MAFNHPHKLELTRSRKYRSSGDRPYVLDGRKRKIYRWDAFYSDAEPGESRKCDLWSLVEYLDDKRKARERTQHQLDSLDHRRLEALIDVLRHCEKKH